MSRKDGAAVFHSEGTLEETLYQIAPGAEECNYQSQTYPFLNAQAMSCSVVCQIADDDGCDDDEDAAFPALGWADAWKQLVLAEERTAAVGTRVVGPEEDEDAQRQEHVIMYLSIEGGCLKCQYVDHRERQGYQQLEHKYANKQEMQNAIRDTYGNTYWYYFDYCSK